MLSPAERILIERYEAAALAWASLRPRPIIVNGVSAYDALQWAFDMVELEDRYDDARRDIRDHVREHGEIETDKGVWAMDPDHPGEVLFRRYDSASAARAVAA